MTYSLLHVQGWIERLLARGVAPDEPDATGWTPLHWAASNDRREAATALMRGGAEIDKRCGAFPWRRNVSFAGGC